MSATRVAAAAPHFSLDYAAPAGCPSREAFLEAVRERAPDAEESAREGGFAFRVTIEATGELVRGRVKLGDGATEREIVPAPCADVASSIALMIAIVLSGEGAEPEATQSAEAEPGDAGRKPARAVPGNTKPAPRVQPDDPVRTAPEGARDTNESEVSVRGGVWGTAGFSDGAAPFPALSLGGGAELWVNVAGLLRPSVRAGVMHVSGDTSVEGRGSAEFRASGFVGRVCPHAFSFASRWSLVACASLEIGELTARGVSTRNGLEQRMPWLAFGVAPRVELALGRVVSLEGELGVRGVVRHDRFVFEPDGVEVYDVPRLAPHLALGASARFP